MTILHMGVPASRDANRGAAAVVLAVLVELVLQNKRFTTGVAGEGTDAGVSLEVVSQMDFLLECPGTLRTPMCEWG